MSVPESELAKGRTSLGRVLIDSRGGSGKPTATDAHPLHGVIQNEIDAAGRVLADIDPTHVADAHAALVKERDVLAHQLGRAALELRKAKDPGTVKVVGGIYDKLAEKVGTLRKSADDLAGKQVERGRDLLDQAASAVADDPLMLAVPKDASPEEIKSAGLADARAAVTQALGARDTRTQKNIDDARLLLPQVQEAITRAERTAQLRLSREAELLELDKAAQSVRDEAVMSAAPKDATPEEIKTAGVEDARAQVIAALGERDTRTQKHIDDARLLLPQVQEAITRAEQAAQRRLSREAELLELDKAAQSVRDEAVMSAVPKDATPEEIKTAGLDDARAAVTKALGERDTRTQQHIDDAKNLLPKVQEAITRAEKAAVLRLAQEKLERERQDYLGVYTNVVKSADEAAALVVSGADSLKKTKLDATIKPFEADSKAHADAVVASKWTDAKDAAGRLATSAPALVTAGTQYDQAKLAFEQAFTGMTDYAAADTLAKNKPPTALADEVKAFTDAVKEMEDEKTVGEWAKAKKVIDDKLDAAATSLVETHQKWNAYDVALGVAASTYRSVFYLRRRMPDFLTNTMGTEIGLMETALDEFNDAVTNKRWSDAKTKIEAVATTGKPVLAAMAEYVRGKSEHDAAYAKIEKVVNDAKNVYFAANGGIQATTEFDAFDTELAAWQQACKDDDWGAAKACLTNLKAAADTLLDPALSSTFGSGDLQDIEDDLNAKATDVATNSATSSNPYITSLGVEILKHQKACADAITADDAITALRWLGELEDALELAQDARVEFGQFETDFAAAIASSPPGAVTAARALGATPAKLAAARDKALLDSENAIKKLANEGRFELAGRRIAKWVEEAQGWVGAWNEAKAAQTTLAVTAPTLPDENKLKALMAKPNGGPVLDALIKDMGERPRRDVMAKVMKVRFGVDLDLKKFEPVMVEKEVDREFDVVKTRQVEREVEKPGPDGPVMVKETVTETYTEKETRKVKVMVHDTDDKGKPKYDRKPDSSKDGSKSVARIYDLMCQVPSDYVTNCPSLKKITRVGGAGGRSETSYFQPGEDKAIVLECGRASAPVGGTRIGKTSELPDVVDDLYKPVGDTAQSYFNWTTLHEIGHAVDDKLGYMDRRGLQADFGGWITYGSNIDSVAEAVVADARHKAGGVQYDIDYVKKLLKGKAKSRPPVSERPAPPTGVAATAWDQARTRIENWVDGVRETERLWSNGAKAKQLAIGGRVYHEAYSDDWLSYDLGARSKGMTGYQFRAPGEWFAELYAAYYSGKLKPGHPFVQIAESL